MTNRKGKRALDEADALAARAITEFRDAARVLGAPAVQDAVRRIGGASKLAQRAVRRTTQVTLTRWLRPSELRRPRWLRNAALLDAANQQRKGTALDLVWLANCAEGFIGIDCVARTMKDLTWLPAAETKADDFAKDLRSVIAGVHRLARLPRRSRTAKALGAAVVALRKQEAAMRRDRPRFVADRRRGNPRALPTAGESAMRDPR
jgi:hypothetical protein